VAFKQIGNAVPPLIGQVVGTAVRSSLASAVKAGLSTRETTAKLARWYRKQPSIPAMPWFKTDNRWKFVLGELLLDRATSTVMNAVWPIIDTQHDLRPGDVPDGQAVDLLDELMSELVGANGFRRHVSSLPR